MKLLANRKIKTLFCWVLLFVIGFPLFFVILIIQKPENAVGYTLVCSLCVGVSIFAVGYRYFKEQNQIMENAVMQIRAYLSQNQDARIECDDEGELYRLFHEVNSLVSILNAHAENEEKAKQFMKATISDISHQLKTPLSALHVYNGILQEEARDSSTIGAFTALSEQELDRIESLVQKLLKIAKLDAGAIVPEKSMENISEMLGGIKRQFSYRAAQEEKQIDLSGDETVVLLCDRNWLTEAISNLVKNALDHTKKGDIIHIAWKEFASVIQIVIKDNGCGIHPGDIHHIFKRFYRSRFSKDTQGIGLGLPLAKSIIDLHNGTIEVDSELGIGTTFTINFLIPTKL